MPFVRNSY